MPLNLSISPAGHLVFDLNRVGSIERNANATIIDAFIKNQSQGLLSLVAAKGIEGLSPSLIYWREFITYYLKELCHSIPVHDLEIPLVPVPSKSKLDELILAIPPMLGAEYCSTSLLQQIWLDFEKWVNSEINRLQTGVRGFLSHYIPSWQHVGRVCFHLAENKNDNKYPFAFLVTYAPHLGKNARIQYQPLNKALQEYAGENNKQLLLRLLKPIHDASKRCKWVHELIDSGDIYHPLAWTPTEAHLLLKSVPLLEESGLVTRLPNWWKKRSKPKVQISIGNNEQKIMSLDALLDFRLDMTIGDQDLTKEEMNSILQAQNGLFMFRNQWIEIDNDKLQEALAHWKSVQNNLEDDGLSFIEGMRLLAGTNKDFSKSNELDQETANWADVKAGSWLKQILQKLRDPETLNLKHPGKLLNAKLRPYQTTGVNWLYFLSKLGLGACLADDMGLGKTIQIIALLLIKKQNDPKMKYPSILVLPASLLSNWKSELEQFAPSLNPLYLHISELLRIFNLYLPLFSQFVIVPTLTLIILANAILVKFNEVRFFFILNPVKYLGNSAHFFIFIDRLDLL